VRALAILQQQSAAEQQLAGARGERAASRLCVPAGADARALCASAPPAPQAYGRSWVGVVCGEETYAHNNIPMAAIPPFAGVAQLQLKAMGLGGTLPLQLRELRTLTTLSFVRNALSGSIPACWCVRAGAWHLSRCRSALTRRRGRRTPTSGAQTRRGRCPARQRLALTC
jgi:hypothetical protein